MSGMNTFRFKINVNILLKNYRQVGETLLNTVVSTINVFILDE